MATTLNGTTLVDPYDVQITRKLRGSGQRSANGVFNIDYYSTTLIREISVKWRMLTVTERNTIITQVENAISTARTLVLPDSDSVSVYFNPEAQFNETKVKSGLGMRYNLDVQFIEAT